MRTHKIRVIRATATGRVAIISIVEEALGINVGTFQSTGALYVFQIINILCVANIIEGIFSECQSAKEDIYAR